MSKPIHIKHIVAQIMREVERRRRNAINGKARKAKDVRKAA